MIDFIHDLFDPTSQRVIAARPDPTHCADASPYCTFLPEDTKQQQRRAKWHYTVPEPPPTEVAAELVRSTFMCTQICCSSEVPMIRSILDPLDGLERILVNVPLKQVLVDHDPSIITASGIESILNKNRFGASIKMDGGASAKSTSTKGRSQFLVQHICCASEIPAINKIVQPIPGVSIVSISVPTKMVYVDHDTAIVSAQQICDALNAHQFGATLQRDAQKSMMSLASVFCTSTLSAVTAINQTSVENVFIKFDSSQLESFIVDVVGKKIVVVHNPLELSVSSIITALLADTNIEFDVVVDGAAGKPNEELNESESPSLPNIYVLTSGFFLIVSLFSYIGHDW
jgi:copper chaperone CopZ